MIIKQIVAPWLVTAWLAVALPIAAAQSISATQASSAAPATSATAAYVPTLTFDVASIHESPPANSFTISGYFKPHSGFYRVTNYAIEDLLGTAYGTDRYQLSGMPDWHRAMFNIEAKSDSATEERLAKLNDTQASLEQQHMLQVLLADRFKLKTHWETREGPGFDLVISKNGLKMQQANGVHLTPEELKQWGDRPIPPLYQQNDGQGYDFIAHRCSMAYIVEMLASQFGHSVSDKTGLTGKYDFTLRYQGTQWSDRDNDDDSSDTNPAPPLAVAIQDQLGLKLKPAKAPVKVLVIDHIEKPSPN